MLASVEPVKNRGLLEWQNDFMVLQPYMSSKPIGKFDGTVLRHNDLPDSHQEKQNRNGNTAVDSVNQEQSEKVASLQDL